MYTLEEIKEEITKQTYDFIVARRFFIEEINKIYSEISIKFGEDIADQVSNEFFKEQI